MHRCSDGHTADATVGGKLQNQESEREGIVRQKFTAGIYELLKLDMPLEMIKNVFIQFVSALEVSCPAEIDGPFDQ